LHTAQYCDIPDAKLILILFNVTKDFSQEYKYNLRHYIKRDGINLVSRIYRATKAKNKVGNLEAFLDDFELIKLEIRLCVDMKILSIKKQAEISSFLCCINSYLGILKHYKTYKLRRNMLLKHIHNWWWNHVYLTAEITKFIVKKRTTYR